MHFTETILIYNNNSNNNNSNDIKSYNSSNREWSKNNDLIL